MLSQSPRNGKRLSPGETVNVWVAIEQTHTLTWRVELWQGYEYLTEDTCRGTYGGGWDWWYLHKGNSARLVGPDGVVLDAAHLEEGSVETSKVTSEEPPALVCAWDVTFRDVPEVNTYDLTFPESDDEWPTVGLSDMKKSNWTRAVWGSLNVDSQH